MSLLFSYEVSAKNFVTTERNGRRSSSESPFIFQGDVQPATSQESLALTGGRLSSGIVVVFSEIPLNISKEGDSESAKGTYVLFEGKWYEVISLAASQTKAAELVSLNHYEYTAEYRELETA